MALSTAQFPLRALCKAVYTGSIPVVASERREAVADRLASLLAAAQEKRRRAGAMDAIIAATALTHNLVIWTQDDDFDILAELAPELVVRRG